MITKKEYDKLEELQIEAAIIESKISNHISDILAIVAKTYGGDLHWWVFPGDEIRGEIASGNMQLGGSAIDVYWESKTPITEDEPEYEGYYLGSQIPSDWLFISVPEIENLLLKNIEKQQKEEEEAMAKAAAKKAAKKAKKEALKASAANKLTLEERKVLGL